MRCAACSVHAEGDGEEGRWWEEERTKVGMFTPSTNSDSARKLPCAGKPPYQARGTGTLSLELLFTSAVQFTVR